MTEDYIVEIKGSGKNPYKVNLKTYACTCPDWRNCRAQQSMDSPRRLCKHLIKAICENGLEGEFPTADLQSLYKKKKGYPLPKDINFLAETHFQQEVDTESVKRIQFLMGDHNTLKNCKEFFKITEDGPVLSHVSSRRDLRCGCERLCWLGLADSCADKSAAELLDGLALKDLRNIGGVLGETFKSKPSGIKILSEHPELDSAFTEAGFNKEDFFILKPLNLDMLR